MVQAIFTEGIDVVTALGLTQWDYGQTLEIHGLNDLPATFQVHFACKRIDEAIVRLATTTNGVGSVVIPDKMLEQDTDLRAWIYIVGDGTGETIKLVQLPIQTRTKPQDFISTVTPSQQTMLEEFLADINESLETSNTTVTQHVANKNNPHNVTFSQVIGSDVVPVSKGGTGGASASDARTNLEITPTNIGAAKSSHTHGNIKNDGTLDVETANQVVVTNDDKKITSSDGDTVRIMIGAATTNHVHGAITNDGKMNDGKKDKALFTGDNGEIKSDILPIVAGGTGATDAATARTNLEITPANIGAAAASHTHDYLPLSGGTVSGVLYVDPAIRCPSIGAGDAKVLMEENVNGGFYQLIGNDGTTYIVDASLNGVFKVYSNAHDPAYWASFNGKTGDSDTNGAIYENGKRVSTADIQIGTATVGTSGATITFPRAFSGTPVVTATGSVPGYIRVYDVTATSFKAVSGNSGSTVQWQAIYI